MKYLAITKLIVLDVALLIAAAAMLDVLRRHRRRKHFERLKKRMEQNVIDRVRRIDTEPEMFV